MSKSLWRGALPKSLTLQELENLWTQVSVACGLPPLCRVFFGPFPRPCHLQICEIRDAQGARAWTKRDCLVLTFHPTVVGGGSMSPATTQVLTVALGASILQVSEVAHQRALRQELCPGQQQPNISLVECVLREQAYL